MDPLLALPIDERADLLNEAGARFGLHPVLVEKDYWVCRTLGLLFDADAPMGALIFKGGTSLSKGYDLIKRFSEDIDVAFDKAQFGFIGDNDPEAATTQKQAKARLDALSAAVAEYVSGPLRLALAERIAERLGEGWSLTPARDDPATLLLGYPSSLNAEDYGGAAYIQPEIRLETGARSDPWPGEARSIRAYAAIEFPDIVGGDTAMVNTLKPERTFWEKATILHAEAHREGAAPGRHSRHYYDLALIADTPFGERALADVDLRKRVVAHKHLYFRSAWARYDLARPGTFKLLPDPDQLRLIERDYAQMASMFFEEPPRFAEVVERLKALEEAINALPADQSQAGAGGEN